MQVEVQAVIERLLKRIARLEYDLAVAQVALAAVGGEDAEDEGG